MQFINDIINYQFLLNAIIAAVLTGVACGIVGTYMVVKKMVFLGGGITHSAFGGVGMAYYLGINTTLGATVFALASALTINKFKNNTRQDTAIGILWSLGMALGILFITITPGYAPNLMSFLFGSILTVSNADLWVSANLDFAIIAVFIIGYRKIVYATLDAQFAKSQGIKVQLIETLMMIMITLTIVVSIKSVGIMLLMSLLTIPTAIVSIFTFNFKKIIIFSATVASLGLILGIAISYHLDFPPAAATVILLASLFFIAKGGMAIFKA